MTLSQDEFYRELYGISRTAFRWEAQPAYALGYDQADFDLFLAGTPVPPPEVGWWRPWLDRISDMTADGKRFSRVRVVEEPPTGYQRWMIWSGRWNIEAGEQITYLTRDTAGQLAIPMAYDWWLLDDERLLMMRYTAAGEIDSKEMITTPGIVARHREWRDLAVRNAQAREILAA
jgi:hypothetical protein